MDTPAPSSRLRGYLAQWLILLGALLTFGGYLAYSLRNDYLQTERDEQERLASQASVIEKNLVPHIFSTRRAIDGILDNLPYWKSHSGGFREASQRLQIVCDTLAGIRNILVIDVDGRVLASNNPDLVGRDLSQRHYFQHALKNPDPRTLYVSPPFTSVLNQHVMSFYRIIPGRDGEFAGVVTAGVDPEFFKTLLDSVRYTPDSWTYLAHGDGKVFMMAPTRQDLLGKDLSTPDSMFTRHRRSGKAADVFSGLAYLTGEERMIAFRTVHPEELHMDKPLVASVSRDFRSIFAQWHREAVTAAGMLGVLTLVACLGLFAFQRRQRALDHVVDLQEAHRKKTEADLRIAATAFQSQEGIVVTDAERVILRINRAFTDITGYPPEEVIGRTPSLLKSGRHDAGFYAAMWDAIRTAGTWQGEIWNRRKSGEIYAEWLIISAVKDGDGRTTHYVGSFIDITERKAAEARIERLVFYDPLTQLPNRRLLLDRLQHVVAPGAQGRRHGALLFIDMDDFKTLNDTLGHEIGDLLLQHVARRLVECVPPEDTVARFGGDEFVVMLNPFSEDPVQVAARAEALGEQIRAALDQTCQLAGYEYHGTPSIGIALFFEHQGNLDELLRRGDLAMYQAKAAGRNTLRMFDPAMQAAVTARAALEAGLRDAIGKDQFRLHYQVQVDADGHPIGAEALLRWEHPQRGRVPPLEFIPLAEDTGLILPIGNWVLQTACAQLAAWARRPELAGLTIAVNVSARQFRHRDFVAQVVATLDGTGADPKRLKLELTESLLVENVEDVIAKMSALKAKGVGFALDDFGTGYSSLSYLKRLPLEQLKIDQGFVRDVLTDPNDAAIARTVVALADSMGLAVIAEGVEAEAQREFLARQGCRAYQGYLFGRPLPCQEFEALVMRMRHPDQKDR